MEDGKSTQLYLRGIVYHRENHFTSRVISSIGNMWYHDGMVTQQTCIDDRELKLTSDDALRTCQDKDLVLAVYAQK